MRNRESAAILLLQHGWKLEDVSRVLAERVQYVPYPSPFNPRFHPYYRQPEALPRKWGDDGTYWSEEQ